MQKKRNWVLILGIVLLFLLIVFVAFKYLSKNKSFEIKSPRVGPIEEAIYGLGTVKSSRVYEHRLGIVTTISRIYFKEGSAVKKGDKIIEFQESSALLAPFNGTITSLPFNEKENIFPQIPIVRIEDLSDRFVEVALEQQGALRVKPQQKVRLNFESIRGELFLGAVESVYPANGQFLVKIKPESLPAEILPGMTTDVAIEVSRKEKALLIPAKSVMGGRVTLLKNGKKEKIEISLGGSDGEWTEVTSNNISEQDQILVPRK